MAMVTDRFMMMDIGLNGILVMVFIYAFIKKNSMLTVVDHE